MANVPVSKWELEDIVSKVAKDLLEEWILSDSEPVEDSELPRLGAAAVDETTFIISRFMDYMNTTMEAKALGLTPQIILPGEK